MNFGNINHIGDFNYNGLVKVADVEITDPYTKLLLNGNSAPDATFTFYSDGESTHTILYLDYANFKINNGTETLWSDDCTSLSTWAKYESKGATVSQVTFDSKSCIKFDAGSGQTQTGIVSGIRQGNYYNNGIKNVGVGKWSVEFSYYADVAGPYGAYFNGFQLSIALDNIYIGLTIWDGGFNCWNGSTHVSLGDPLVEDVWQTWRIEVDVPTHTANFYLNNVLTFTGVTLAVGTYVIPWYASTGQDPVFYNHACCTQSIAKFGDGCISLDGTDDYITFADSDDWNFGSGDFTIDFWIRWNNLPTEGNHNYIINQWYSTTNQRAWSLNISRNSGVYYLNWAHSTSGSDVIQPDAIALTISTGTWYHFAVVRNGTNLKFFQDGTQVGSTYNIGTDILFDSSAKLGIGAINVDGTPPSEYFNGWLAEIRVSKGIARWTSAFDAPTSAYPVNYETNSLLISDTLDGDVDGDYILESRIIAGTNAAARYSLYSCTSGVVLNSDTGYYSYPAQAIYGDNSTITTVRYYWSQSLGLCNDSQTTGNVSYSRLAISSKSGYFRTGFTEQSNAITGSTITGIVLAALGYTNTFGATANITKLTAVSPAGGIGYGSRFILWKKAYRS